MATEVKVTSKQNPTKADIKATFSYDFGADLKEAEAKFGAKMVYDIYLRGAVIAAQATARRLLDAGKSIDEVKAELAKWRPDVVVRVAKDPKAAAAAAFGKMSPEEKLAFIKEIQAQAAKK